MAKLTTVIKKAKPDCAFIQLRSANGRVNDSIWIERYDIGAEYDGQRRFVRAELILSDTRLFDSIKCWGDANQHIDVSRALAVGDLVELVTSDWGVEEMQIVRLDKEKRLVVGEGARALSLGDRSLRPYAPDTVLENPYRNAIKFDKESDHRVRIQGWIESAFVGKIITLIGRKPMPNVFRGTSAEADALRSKQFCDFIVISYRNTDGAISMLASNNPHDLAGGAP